MTAARAAAFRFDGDDFGRVQAWALANVCDLTRDAVPGWGKGPDGHLRGPCFFHGGDDANLDVRDGHGWHCHSACATGGDGVDLWRRVHFPHLDLKAGRLAALRDLAPRAGVNLDRAPSRRPFTPRATGAGVRVSAPPTPAAGPPDDVLAGLAALRAEGMIPATLAAILGAFYAALTLPPAGRDFLAARGFDPDAAEGFGFRWITGPAEWRELAAVADDFHPAELACAGLAPSWPRVAAWSPPPPALVIPYTVRGALAGLRFRNGLPDAPHAARYRDNTAAPWWSDTGRAWPRWPFNADALNGAAGQVVHVVEGELNAYALTLHGRRAIGLSGAGKWGAEWTPGLRDVRHVVTWYDADAAGAKGRTKLADTLRDAFGLEWVRARGIVPPLPAGSDVNDLHRAGLLARLLETVPA